MTSKCKYNVDIHFYVYIELNLNKVNKIGLTCIQGIVIANDNNFDVPNELSLILHKYTTVKYGKKSVSEGITYRNN